jgi:hypothetical protein
MPDLRFEQVACDLLSRGCGIRFRAPGQSMHPTIRDGEAIRVEPVLPLRIRRGDIVLYRWERGIRAHRVVQIVAQASACEAPVFLLRGDGGSSDEVVQASQVLGKVVSLERNGRSIPLSGARPKVWRAVRRCSSSFKRLMESGWRSEIQPAPARAARRILP